MSPSLNGSPQASSTVPEVGATSFPVAFPQAHTVYNVVPTLMLLISFLKSSTVLGVSTCCTSLPGTKNNLKGNTGVSCWVPSWENLAMSDNPTWGAQLLAWLNFLTNRSC